MRGTQERNNFTSLMMLSKLSIFTHDGIEPTLVRVFQVYVPALLSCGIALSLTLLAEKMQPHSYQILINQVTILTDTFPSEV